ncbi:hypothetical protein [Thermoflavimicrobium daqui]|jgi:hypothetical protein|uniref:Uncharacterized protein n=1 Tax=Thermoflavimicrobium daqui TaxID=2137476 RepID=A0A364K5X3_9BACL|nr:hypothetical protein [Thermoflavimicrobium daqui]RAL25668.1 hypothetical protein DL897_06205 [Thermoflavimicrobium daqui]
MVIWDTSHPFGKSNKSIDSNSYFQVELKTTDGHLLQFTFLTGRILEFEQVTVIGGKLNDLTTNSNLTLQNQK